MIGIPAYRIKLLRSGHHFRLIRCLSQNSGAATDVGDLDRNFILVYREYSYEIGRSIHYVFVR
jgi:hypothetical protein